MDGRKIRNIRKKLGLTQEEFAGKLGVSFVTLNRWENHKHSPSSLAIRRLEELEATTRRK